MVQENFEGFTYSINIVPQTKRANRYKFVSLEKLEREKAKEHGVLEMLTLVYFNDRPKKIGESGLQVPSAFGKVFTSRIIENVFSFGIQTNTIRKKVKTHILTKEIVMKFLDYGGLSSPEGWTVNDTNTLKDLLNKYVVTQKDQSKVGVDHPTESWSLTDAYSYPKKTQNRKERK